VISKEAMKKTLLTVLVLIAIAAMPAAADTILVGQSTTHNFTWNTGSGTVTGTAIFTLNSNTSMTITIANTSGPGAYGIRPALTAVGFNSTPNLSNMTMQTISSNLDWHFGNGTGIGNGTYEVRAGDPGVCNQGPPPGTSPTSGPNRGAICAGQTGTFTFTFTGLTGNSLTLDGTTLKFQTEVGSFHPTGTPGNPVPEPASLALLGTGLISAGGFIRRKLNK
jgi:hypothetical protein